MLSSSAMGKIIGLRIRLRNFWRAALHRCAGAQLVNYIKSRPVTPYDGHMLAAPIIENGTAKRKCHQSDCRRSWLPRPKSFFSTSIPNVYCWSARPHFGIHQSYLHRRSVIEYLIDLLEEDRRIVRNFPTSEAGEGIHELFVVVGYNFKRILAWMSKF